MKNINEISNVLDKIRGLQNSLSLSENKIANYILGNYQIVIRMTLSDVASHAGVSDATVVRFYRTIGYSKWKEFVLDLSRMIPFYSKDSLKEIKSTDSPGQIAMKVMDGAILAIRTTKEIVDEDAYSKAINLIENANNVIIIGSGASAPLAHELFIRLFRLDINCQVLSDSYLQVMRSALVRNNNVVITISHTGETTPLLAARLAKKNGSKVISITGNRNSSLAKISDVVLLAVSHLPMDSTLSSRIAMHVIIHGIYINLVLKNQERVLINEGKIKDALKSLRPFNNNNEKLF